MQDITGTELATTWAAPVRRVRPKLEIQWNGSTWTDETARLLSAMSGGSLIRQPQRLPFLGRVEPMQAEFVLANEDHRFSPENTAGPLYGILQYGFRRIAVRFSMGIANSAGTFEYLRQFTGRIDRATPSAMAQASGGVQEIIHLSCLDESDALQQAALSTPIWTNLRSDEAIASLATGLIGLSLSRGRTIIPYLWLDDEKRWAEIQEIAFADAGWAYVDKEGVLRFETLDDWLGSGTPVATLSADRWWAIEQDEGWENAYTAVEVGYTPRHPAPPRAVYRAHETFILAPGETRVIWANLDTPCLTVLQPEEDVDYIARGAGNLDLGTYLTIGITAYAQRARVEMTNANTKEHLYIVGFSLRGIPLEAEEEYEERLEAEAQVLADWWRGADANYKVWREVGNPYIQTRQQARRRAGLMRDLLQRPRQLWRVRCAACPFLEYGDLVTVAHAASGLEANGFIVGITVRWELNAGYVGEYLVLPAEGLFSQAPYFILGQDTYGDASKAVFW